MAITIPDVSRWQGTIDFGRLLPVIDGIIIKCGGGDDGLYQDSQFPRNRDAVRNAGKPHGFYWFAGGGDPRAEARKFKEVVGDTQPGESLWLDFETGVSNGDPVGWCDQFQDEAESLFGQKVHLYTNMGRVWAFDWNRVVAKDRGLWGAIWDFNPNTMPDSQEWAFVALKQYSDKGSLAGIAGAVDLSAFNGNNISQFLSYGKKGDVKPPLPNPTPPSPVVPPTPMPTGKTYTVVSGDTLTGIASKLGLNYNELRAANPQIADPNKIYVGQLIYLSAGIVPVVQPVNKTGYHIVLPGENLSLIASHYGMSLNDLLNLNPQYKANPNYVRIGAQILVKESAPQQVTTYTVKSGDTLSGIAAKFGTSWQRLRDINGLADPDHIEAGWVLRIV